MNMKQTAILILVPPSVVILLHTKILSVVLYHNNLFFQIKNSKHLFYSKLRQLNHLKGNMLKNLKTIC